MSLLRKKPANRRRMEVRKQAGSKSSAPIRQRLGLLWGWPMGATGALALGTWVIAISGDRTSEWVSGQTIDRPIAAQVQFQYEDTARQDQLKETARAQTPSVYIRDPAPVEKTIARVRKLYERAKASESFAAFAELAEAEGWDVDEGAYAELRRLAAVEGAAEFVERLDQFRTLMMEEYTAAPRVEERRQPASTANTIRVVSVGLDGVESVTEINAIEQLVYTTQTRVLEGQASRLARSFPFALRRVVSQIVLEGLQSSPLLVYDAGRTQEAMMDAAQAVEPVMVTVEPGQDIIAMKPGQPMVLTEAHIERLERHDAALEVFRSSDDPAAVRLRKQELLQRVGLGCIFALLSLGIMGTAWSVYPRILENPARASAFVGLIVGATLLAKVVDSRWAFNELMLAPALVLASILTIAYRRRFAISVGIIIGVVMTLTIRGNIEIYVTYLIALAVCCTMLGEIRSRTRVINTGLASGVAAAAAALAFCFMDKQEVSYSFMRAGWAGASVMLAAVFIQGTLPFIERAFGITTALTLLEWRDASRPLLQLLARDAPGTYAHSLVLSTMAEAACEAIGANGLLAGVGALYHDIGKIPKAEYFAENQEAAINRHDRLSPTMSLLIIVGHVKDGVEMAKEYGLPRSLTPFIEEHHGTTLVRYFHHAAIEKQPKIASGRHDRSVSETEFRYPGPKPKSKETAILMLCDSVEGAVRSLAEPTAGRIEHVVHQIMMDRLNDGQFDLCDVTLKELHAVEASLVKSLVRFYHGRVAYPKGGPGAKDAALTPQQEAGPVPAQTSTA